MNVKRNLVIALITIISLIGGAVPQPSTPVQEAAYVEPGLLSPEAKTLSVIVTADDSGAAARAVERVGGLVTSDLWLIDAVAATISTSQLEALAAYPQVRSIVNNKGVETADGPDDDGWVTDFRFPVPWDGSPDVQATNNKKVWRLVYPAAIDVGADVLHDDDITGEGITVAVVDTGVYFDKQVKQELGAQVAKQFVGQADFVGDGTCSETSNNENPEHKQAIIQYDGYCWTGYDTSRDRYGHGSHVAGTVWNNFTDYDTGVTMGIAPDAEVLSVRVLDDDGIGTYEDVIEGIQYVVANKDQFNIRVLNLSLSALATTPYFVDPLDRAAEQAWAHGIVVLAAAGNVGPAAETITVPGNDPYVITVGAVDGQRTPGYWADDVLPKWSATGPTLDGFAKPDVLAPGMNIVSFMYNDHDNMNNSARLVQEHPDYSETSSLFRMNGTSMASALTSGVVALMLQAHPELTPDQVKFRLMYTARPALTEDGDLVYSILQQGIGRIWAPDAVLSDEIPADGQANLGMDINADLEHGTGWVDANGDGLVQMEELDPDELAYHYQGPIRKALSDDGSIYLYYVVDGEGLSLIHISEPTRPY